MSEPATDAELLRGKAVAFTGKLASMTRARAAELVRAFGGRWVSSVTRRTSILVVGQEGWPLRKDGRLSHKLLLARKIQPIHPIQVISESDLLARLGLEPETPFHRLSTVELSRLLNVPGERIRAWVELGLLRPLDTTHGVHCFDFRQASWAKSLCGFIQAGVSPRRIRQSLEKMKHWLPAVEEPLAQLSVLEEDGHLLVRLEEGHLCEPTGQGLFDFQEAPPMRTVQVNGQEQTRSADQWIEIGCGREDRGELKEAAEAYRQALALGGPNRDAAFNLANVLYALGGREQAAERFRQALEIDSGFASAWNNLGNVLSELGDRDEAMAAFRKALALNPEDGDAHYNLADLLEETGRHLQAKEHWRAYLRHDAASAWADFARQRLRHVD